MQLVRSHFTSSSIGWNLFAGGWNERRNARILRETTLEAKLQIVEEEREEFARYVTRHGHPYLDNF